MSKVRFKRSELPPLTDKQQAELDALSRKQDSDIQCDDIAPLDDSFWQAAERGVLPPGKTRLRSESMRIFLSG